MEKIILLWFDLALIGMYLLIGFIAFLLIQLVCYRILRFNLYKKIMEILGVL